MRYLSLPAWRGGRPVYPAELILALGWSTAGMTWLCQDLEVCPGPEKTSLEEASASHKKLTTLELLKLPTPDVQVVDGEVTGYKKQQDGEIQPIMTLRAVDSTTWDLEILSESDFQRIQTAFPEATEPSPELFAPGVTTATEASGSSMQAIMDGMIERLHPKLPGSALGEIFDHLAWTTDDNRHDLFEICRQWLESDDIRRVDAALALNEAYLLDSREELENNLRPVAD